MVKKPSHDTVPVNCPLCRNVDAQRWSVDNSLEEVEAQIQEIQSRAAGRPIPRFQQSQLDRLEQQVFFLKHFS
jgi:hypothetical protein